MGPMGSNNVRQYKADGSARRVSFGYVTRGCRRLEPCHWDNWESLLTPAPIWIGVKFNANVRYWHLADMPFISMNVRFWG